MLKSISFYLILLLVSEVSAQDYLGFEKDGKWGLMNPKGEELFPPIFDSAYGWHGIAIYKIGDSGDEHFEAGIITADGARIALSNRVFLDLAHSSQKFFTHVYLRVWGKNGLGVVDSNGVFVVPAKYDRIGRFDMEDQAVFRLNGLWGAMNIHGEILVKQKYLTEDKAKLALLHYKVGLDHIVYDDINWSQRNSGLIPVYKGKIMRYETEDKWGFCNEQGELVIPLQYEERARFRNGRGVVVKNGKPQLIETNGEVLSVFNGKEIILVRNPIVITSSVNKLTNKVNSFIFGWNGGLIQAFHGELQSLSGNPNPLSELWTYSKSGLGSFYSGKDVGLINIYTGKFIIDPKYSYMKYMPGGYIKVAKGCKLYSDLGSRNKDQLCTVEGEGFVPECENCKFGLFADNGRMILKPIYDQIGNITQTGECEVILKGETKIVFIKDNCLIAAPVMDSVAASPFSPSPRYYPTLWSCGLDVCRHYKMLEGPTFETQNMRIYNIYDLKNGCVKIVLQDNSWGYANVELKKLIYWNGKGEEVIKEWIHMLPDLFED